MVVPRGAVFVEHFAESSHPAGGATFVFELEWLLHYGSYGELLRHSLRFLLEPHRGLGHGLGVGFRFGGQLPLGLICSSLVASPSGSFDGCVTQLEHGVFVRG